MADNEDESMRDAELLESPEALPEIIQCPHCAEDIKREAKICKHCKQAVDEPLQQMVVERIVEGSHDPVMEAKMQNELAGSRGSVGLCYLLYFLGGVLGLHKFAMGSPFQGLIYLGCFLSGFVLVVPWILLALGLLFDLFTIPMQVGQENDVKANAILKRYKKK